MLEYRACILFWHRSRLKDSTKGNNNSTLGPNSGYVSSASFLFVCARLGACGCIRSHASEEMRSLVIGTEYNPSAHLTDQLIVLIDQLSSPRLSPEYDVISI